MPTLWASGLTNRGHPSLLELCLQRSRDSPLHVTLSSYGQWSRGVQGLSLLWQHSSRWQTAVWEFTNRPLDICPFDLDSRSDISLSRLSKLTIEDDSDSFEPSRDPPLPAILAAASHLQTLDVTEAHRLSDFLEKHSPLWGRLTGCMIRSYIDSSLCVQILRAAPHLEMLNVSL